MLSARRRDRGENEGWEIGMEIGKEGDGELDLKRKGQSKNGNEKKKGRQRRLHMELWEEDR